MNKSVKKIYIPRDGTTGHTLCKSEFQIYHDNKTHFDRVDFSSTKTNDPYEFYKSVFFYQQK